MAAPAFTPLAIRKLADRSEGERVARFDPETGQRHLVNPATGEPEPWPLAGITIEGEAPKRTRVPTSFVTLARAEGYLRLVGEQLVHRPGGPPEDPWRITHTFVHAEKIVLDTVDGAVTYKVEHQPDKYEDEQADEETGTPGGRVDWFYDLRLEA